MPAVQGLFRMYRLTTGVMHIHSGLHLSLRPISLPLQPGHRPFVAQQRDFGLGNAVFRQHASVAAESYRDVLHESYSVSYNWPRPMARYSVFLWVKRCRD